MGSLNPCASTHHIALAMNIVRYMGFLALGLLLGTPLASLVMWRLCIELLISYRVFMPDIAMT